MVDFNSDLQPGDHFEVLFEKDSRDGEFSGYLYLSSIAKGLRSGTRVSQGDVIGPVGASGVVTGPHLDYRLTKHGVFVNPLVEQRRLPAGDPISAGLLKAFEAVRDEALAQLTKQLGAPETLVAGSREPADALLARP